ncbi:site-specific integrase [Chitinophaga sp. 30R24]|uniref:site-specific integrase n=1 Tax=Chitinophaga sp. 30R24 TaxID=3248838 RepID=UPI003B9087DE
MLLPIKLICSKSKARRDGTSIIFIQYCGVDNRKTLLNTEIAIPPRFWSRKHHRISNDLPPEYGKASDLNTKLSDLLKLAGDIVTHARKANCPDVLAFVKKAFKPDYDLQKLREDIAVNPNNNQDFFYQVDDYIKCKTGKVSEGTLKNYKNMKDHILAFQDFRKGPVTFDSFDFNFYESFVDFMTRNYVHKRRKEEIKGLKLSSIGKTIKQLRIFIRDRGRRKIIAPIDLTDFKVLDEEADAIYLTWEEITKIYGVDLSEYPHLIKYRDLFVLGCFTGLRFSDFSTIRPEDIRTGMLHKKQDKSDNWVVIPLMDATEEILYNRFDKLIPHVSNPEFNRHIKQVGKLAGICELVKFSHKKGNKDIIDVRPKYAWITTHTCRRSFCTNEFLAGTPVELIMKISGHKSLRDFYKYIRITPEEAGKKIKEIWQKRGNVTISSPANSLQSTS